MQDTTIENRLRLRLERAIEDKIFPGCVAGIANGNGKRSILAAGNFTYENDSATMKENSIFDVASITKAIPVSSLALALIDEGKLSPEHRLIDYIPEYRSNYSKDVLIRHLLTHTLDFGFRLSDYKDSSPDDILGAIFSAPLKNMPGASFFYSNATSILLGLVVEKIYGKCLAISADEVFFKPLNMSRTTFFPESFPVSDVVPTEIDEWRGRIIRAEVHDESAFTLRKKIIAGSAGLFSTGPDLLNFIEMMLNNGIFKGRRYFSACIMEQIRTNQVSIPGVCTGLGWELNQNRYMGYKCSPRCIGKTGFTGCVCMADCEKKTGFVLLSNYTFPKRKPDASLINLVRQDCADIVFSDY